MLRVRFAPSPTGYLHIGSARTFIFNWLYARRNGGTMILRIDDTDVERNTQTSLDSIFDGLHWLGLGWDERYRQSDRLELHKRVANQILDAGMAYRDFTNAPRTATARVILAMSHQRLGRADEARAELAMGRELVETKLKRRIDRGTPMQGFWFDWAFARALLKEAAALIETPPVGP